MKLIIIPEFQEKDILLALNLVPCIKWVMLKLVPSGFIPIFVQTVISTLG